MRFFRSKSAAASVIEPPPVRESIRISRPPVVEGWSEQQLVSVYNAAPVKQLKPGEAIFLDAEETGSFFVLLGGEIEIVVKWNGHKGRPGAFRRGDCVPPLPKAPGLQYHAEAVDHSSIIELPHSVLSHLPDKTVLAVYKAAVGATSRINAYIRSVNGEIQAKNSKLSAYIVKDEVQRAKPIESEFVQNFLRDMPRMPTYATDMAMKLLDSDASVQEVVEGIKRDPAVVGSVLRVVNSAQYGFAKKIENFYHACMILGFNNIYNIILREAVKSAMPSTAETEAIHKHSCLISVLCFEIATIAKDVQTQTATTIGLLHDMGKGVRLLMKHSNPTKADFIATFPSANLGGALLRQWGLPERVCKIIELQHHPEFTRPDQIPAEYRREVATLHLAHAVERLLAGQTLEEDAFIFTTDYMTLLGFGNATVAGLLEQKIMPSLTKNQHRLPESLRHIVK